jgi:hypothetical protein
MFEALGFCDALLEAGRSCGCQEGSFGGLSEVRTFSCTAAKRHQGPKCTTTF